MYINIKKQVLIIYQSSSPSLQFEYVTCALDICSVWSSQIIYSIIRFGFHGTLWFYSGISIVALLYGFYFMPDYSRYPVPSTPYTALPSQSTPSFHSIFFQRQSGRDWERGSRKTGRCLTNANIYKHHNHLHIRLDSIDASMVREGLSSPAHKSSSTSWSWQRLWAGGKATNTDKEHVVETKLCWPGWDPFYCVLSCNQFDQLAEIQDEGGNDKTQTKARWTFSFYHHGLSSPTTS